MNLTETSKKRLKGVHPDLVRVVNRAAKDWKDTSLTWIVTEGVRTVERQKELVVAGASKTMNSRHIPGKDGFAKAVDLAAMLDGKVRWDWPLYDKLAKAMKAAAKVEKVPLEWGGDWKSFKDGPHFQLPKVQYP